MTDTPSGSNAADRLQAGVGDLHVPDPSADSESLLLKVGFALPLVGLVLIGLAWYRSAGTKYVADQVPMLISGGILGLGLILVGLGLFLRFSLARLVRFGLAHRVVDQQAQTERLIDALAKVESAIRDATTDQPVVVQLPDQART